MFDESIDRPTKFIIHLVSTANSRIIVLKYAFCSHKPPHPVQSKCVMVFSRNKHRNGDLETFIRTHMKPSLRVRVTWVGHGVDFNLGVNSNPQGHGNNAYQYRGIGNLRWEIANFGSAGSYVETDGWDYYEDRRLHTSQGVLRAESGGYVHDFNGPRFRNSAELWPQAQDLRADPMYLPIMTPEQEVRQFNPTRGMSEQKYDAWQLTCADPVNNMPAYLLSTWLTHSH